MKRALVLLMLFAFVCMIPTDAKRVKEKQNVKKEVKVKKAKALKDVLSDEEYKQIKTQYFQAEGYGHVYNCPVAKQRFCKVKAFDTGDYMLCDREVSRRQMDSAKTFYKLGKCVKLN